ncbi:hypothetical protein KI387_041025, partial [Taxus chinensis]
FWFPCVFIGGVLLQWGVAGGCWARSLLKQQLHGFLVCVAGFASGCYGPAHGSCWSSLLRILPGYIAIVGFVRVVFVRLSSAFFPGLVSWWLAGFSLLLLPLTHDPRSSVASCERCGDLC